ncbi:hypothetical protein [Paenibacillus sp. Soil750]|uniref:hypothetical protein n=1 Tax=Paenibacillus sp. Soil750 TaxID=1736398 RepID=UPI0006FAFF6F|nr:hypothetical protein [Paenibacillus sp. Soil750]KRE64637.1 hypothetical protein ASL11_21420 [Paenibacillus sp. Soil750]
MMVNNSTGCECYESIPDLVQMKAIDKPNSVKPVIFIHVDSLLSSAIDEGISKDMLPTFKYLKEHGQYHKEFVSSFPTMSVTIDSTLCRRIGLYQPQRIPSAAGGKSHGYSCLERYWE